VTGIGSTRELECRLSVRQRRFKVPGAVR